MSLLVMIGILFSRLQAELKWLNSKLININWKLLGDFGYCDTQRKFTNCACHNLLKALLTNVVAAPGCMMPIPVNTCNAKIVAKQHKSITVFATYI